MNKMIQRQDIVPPWIEKQQEVVKTANIFRTRLRNDWKRHAARTIASQGGTLHDQMRKAERYAEAEKMYNPKRRKVETIAVPSCATDDPVMVKIMQEPPKTSENSPPTVRVSIERSTTDINPGNPLTPQSTPSLSSSPAQEPHVTTPLPLPSLFRLPSWESAESAYLNLAIKNLNSLTRSYNLMAPELAKKPYFSLERELRSCYADVAPQLAQLIKERAARPEKQFVESVGHRPGSVLDKFTAKETVRIYDNKKPLYGFKQFWSDLFDKEGRA